MSSRVLELVTRAKSIISSGEPGKMDLWRAYVAVESAILDLKLRRQLEGQAPPPRPARKKVNIALAREMLDRIEHDAEPAKLLYDLRACRDILKALVAGYARRSTTS